MKINTPSVGGYRKIIPMTIDNDRIIPMTIENDSIIPMTVDNMYFTEDDIKFINRKEI